MSGDAEAPDPVAVDAARGLSAEQVTILAELASGRRTQAGTAAWLGMTEDQMRRHTARIRRLLGVTSTDEAIEAARAAGVLPAGPSRGRSR